MSFLSDKEKFVATVKEQVREPTTWLLFLLPLLIYSLRKWLKGPTKGTDNPKRLDGRTVVITGGNCGIGEETSKDLARRGAKVYILCRNVKQGHQVVDQIVSSFPKAPHPEVIQLDLSSLDSVRECADQLIKKLNCIDYLINNAGVMLTGPEKTVDGFDMQFGTNHLGHFLLTELLLPLVKKSDELGLEPRIVIVSSEAHRHSPINWTDVNFQTGNSWGSFRAYAQSKLANVLHAKKLARDLAGTGIKCFSLHPGVILTTNLSRHVAQRWWFIYYPYAWTLKPLIQFMTKNNRDGAQTTLFCALDDSVVKDNGKYFSDCRVKEPIHLANNVNDQDLLDKLSRKLVGLEEK